MADVVAMTQTAAAAAEAVSTPVNYMGILLTLTRWAHYIAGVMWIGHLWFFNFVNSNLQADAKYPAEMKKVVNPLLMTRSLFMFRWGAMFTLITGLMLLGFIYRTAAVWALPSDMNGHSMKALYMGMGVIFGGIMWRNVWFVIWPRQKKIIGAAQGGPAVDPELAKQAGKASRTNTFLSVPMLLGMMGGAHTEYQLPGGYIGLVVGIAIGMWVVKLTYKYAPMVDTQIFKG
jgi:uncharacterized membrane protein